MKNHDGTGTPNVRIPPPLIVAVFIGLGLLLDKLLGRSHIFEQKLGGQIGAALVAVAAGLSLWTMIRYYRHKTNILPHAADQTLIKDGPFRFSRNPIYLAFLLAHIGCALIFNSLFVLMTVLASYLVLRYYVIAREEAYLIRHFGEPYLEFKRRVRRWI